MGRNKKKKKKSLAPRTQTNSSLQSSNEYVHVVPVQPYAQQAMYHQPMLPQPAMMPGMVAPMGAPGMMPIVQMSSPSAPHIMINQPIHPQPMGPMVHQRPPAPHNPRNLDFVRPGLQKQSTIDAKVDKYRDKLIRKKQKEERRKSQENQGDTVQAQVERRKSRRKRKEAYIQAKRRQEKDKEYTTCRIVLFLLIVAVPTIFSVLCFYADVQLLLLTRNDASSYAEDIDYMKNFEERQEFYCQNGICVLLDQSGEFFQSVGCDDCSVKNCADYEAFTNCDGETFDLCNCSPKYARDSPQVNTSIVDYRALEAAKQKYNCNPELTYQATEDIADVNIENFFTLLFWVGAVFVVIAVAAGVAMNACRIRMACMKFSDKHDSLYLVPEKELTPVSPETPSPATPTTVASESEDLSQFDEKRRPQLNENNLRRHERYMEYGMSEDKRNAESHQNDEDETSVSEMSTNAKEALEEEKEIEKSKQKKRKVKTFIYMICFTILLNILEFVPIGICGIYYLIYWNIDYGVDCLSKFRAAPGKLHELAFNPDGNFAQLIMTSDVLTLWFGLNFWAMFFIGFTGIRMTSFRLAKVAHYGFLQWLKFFFLGCVCGIVYIVLIGAPVWGVAWVELPEIFDLKSLYLDALKYAFITGMALWFIGICMAIVAFCSKECREMVIHCVGSI